MAENDRTIVVDGGSGNGLASVLTVLIVLVVLLVAGVFLYRAGVFGHNTKHEIDINVNKPGAVMLLR
ncbi:MAG TPA: hypothetical protein VFC63_01285 [Blastocatellia bacterium]|nr:hypothetical protein [Blastocatellia bacterium]